jgi:LPS-assembly protein
MRNKIIFILFFGIFFLKTNITSAQQKDIYNFSADKLTYSQDNNIIEATGNVVAKNQEGKQITADKIIYNKTNQLLKTFGNSKFTDSKNRTLTAENFEYDLEKKIISAENKVKFLDNYKNIYYFSKLNADDKFNEIIGYNLNSDLNKEKFQSKDKFNEFIEPRLSGKEVTIKDNITIIKDGKFTSCKSTNEKEGCPYWNLNASLVTHDKENKNITYKNATLDVNNIPILYTPYFSHPDPSVKREAGFLAPTFATLGTDIGSTIKVPYFYPVSQSADITISPVYYFKQNPLILGEYREKFKNGALSIEGGFTEGYKEITSTQTNGFRHHLYGNLDLEFQNKILDQSIFNAKVQKVNNSTYLRVNKINSTNDGFKKNLVKEDDTKLTNEIYLNSYSANENLNLKAATYQNITLSGDQYEYLFPEVAYSKYGIFNEANLNFNTLFKSQNINTNQNKSTFVNELNHSTAEAYNSNIGIGYKFLTKLNNINYYSDYNSPKQNLNNEINPVIGLDASMPFAKITKESEQYLVPRILTRYAPGKMANATSNDTMLSTDNLFSMNRMNNNELIEKDLSFNLGLDWEWREKQTNSKKLSENAQISIGQVLKLNKDLDMPTKSSLQNKTSDIVTRMSYSIPGSLDLTLKNTVDNDLSHIYYNDLNIKTTFGATNEINFNFYEKNNHIGNERYAKANFSSYLTDNSKLKIESDRNLKTDRTNSHKLGIENENECIRYGFYFQKNYYSDKDLKPATSVFFGITLLPFGDNYTTGNIIPSISGKQMF